MRPKLIILSLFLLPGVLHAQTVKDWLIHPSLSAASLVSAKYDVGADKFTPAPLVMLRARFGEDTGPFYATVLFDLPSTRFLTCEAVWQPIHQVGVRFGLQKMLYLFETMYAPYLTGISSRSRDVGIVLRGAFWPAEGYSKFSYAFGVFNGNGYSLIDNNRAKDLQLRLVYQPIPELKISLGAMNGYYNLTREGVRTEELAHRQRLSLGVWYEGEKMFVRSEDLFGITDGIKSNGIMALAGYRPWPRILFTGRADNFKRDMSDPLSASTKLEIAFTHYLVSDGTIYYSLQYGHTFFSNPDMRGIDALMFCVNVAFLRKL